jgi:hypothetical protein
MRKLLLASVVALPLGGCLETVQTYTPAVSPVVSAVVSVAPEAVQSAAVAACGYLPTAQTVASLVSVWTGVQVPDIAQQIAAEICAAVTTPRSARRSTTRPVVRGVVITGAFVR